MNEAFHTAIAEAKYAYQDETPTQEDFLATFKSFYQELCVTGENGDSSMTNALNRAAVVYADDVSN